VGRHLGDQLDAGEAKLEHLRVQQLPNEICGAKVKRFAVLGAVRPSERLLVQFEGAPIERPVAIAICQYEGEDDFYLLHCAADGSVLGAGHYGLLQAALDTAELGYPGISAHWVESK